MREEANYGSTGVGFIDGGFMPVSEMRLPITDMGFQLGDMCYDAVHVHKGRFFRLRTISTAGSVPSPRGATTRSVTTASRWRRSYTAAWRAPASKMR